MDPENTEDACMRTDLSHLPERWSGQVSDYDVLVLVAERAQAEDALFWKRGEIEAAFEATKNEIGLAHYEVRPRNS